MIKRENVPKYKLMRENGLMTSHVDLPDAEKTAATYLKSFPQSFACIYKIYAVQSLQSVLNTEIIGEIGDNYVLPFESRYEESCATLRESEGQVNCGEGEYQGCHK